MFRCGTQPTPTFDDVLWTTLDCCVPYAILDGPDNLPAPFDQRRVSVWPRLVTPQPDLAHSMTVGDGVTMGPLAICDHRPPAGGAPVREGPAHDPVFRVA